jgi:hypothetical protein
MLRRVHQLYVAANFSGSVRFWVFLLYGKDEGILLIYRVYVAEAFFIECIGS